MQDIDEFLKQHRITEIEAIIPDMAGIARGKIIPRSKFESGESMRLPQAVMIQTVTGDYPEDGTLTGVTDPDMVCVPDASTIRLIPWAVDPTAQVIHDCVHFDGTPVAISPRRVLRQVLELYKARGWKPVIAPELEFYLVDMNKDPICRCNRRSAGPGVRRRAARRTRSKRSTNSIRCSKTSTSTATFRSSKSTR